MKRILLRSRKSPFEVFSHEQAIHRDVIATNSGNLIFSNATHKILQTEQTEIISNHFVADARDADRINEEFHAFVVPLANAFRPSFADQLTKLSNLIEHLKIPVVVLGVGAQANLNYDAARLRGIESLVKRFVRAVLDRSTSIGVRGEFTGQYLNDLGFRDVEIIGCPSMFMNGDRFEVTKRAATLSRSARIAINGSHTALRTGHVSSVMDAAYEKYPNLTYIAQNIADAEMLYWGDTSEASGLQRPVPAERTHPLVRDNKVRLFIDPLPWIDYLRSCDFSFGGRIHGNMAALLAGTPAVVLCHDSRTLELCRYFDIPHLRATDVAADTDPADLYAMANFDKLVTGHKERFDRFTAFLDKHGLENVFVHGDSGAAFEARMRSTEFPPGIEVWNGSDDGSLGYRVAWLRENTIELLRQQAESAKRIAELTGQTAALQKRLAALEDRGGPAYRRTRRAVGRPVRKILDGLGGPGLVRARDRRASVTSPEPGRGDLPPGGSARLHALRRDH